MEHKIKTFVQDTLNKLDFVDWDRFISLNENYISVFGWIKRKGELIKDFVILDFDLIKKKSYFILTSSKKYSKRISKIFKTEHHDCERIENTFEVTNCIKLKEVTNESNKS